MCSWCKGKSDGERGRNDLRVGHMTLLPECARSIVIMHECVCVLLCSCA
jgi:hypothetical protein